MRNLFSAIKDGITAGDAHGSSSREPAPSVEAKSAPAPEPRLEPERPQEEIMLKAPSAAARNLSVLGPSVVFKGKLSAEEDLLIQGRVEGSINHTAPNLTIGAQGDVKADIVAQKVIVQGKVQGDIRASDAVIVEPSAQVLGNIFAPRVALKEGAKFSGRIDMGAAMQDAETRDGAPNIGEPKVDELLARART